MSSDLGRSPGNWNRVAMEPGIQSWAGPISFQSSRRSTANESHPISYTQSPIVTGSSVVAIRYSEGVMMTADCLASYGSLSRFRSVQRMAAIDQTVLLGSSGDYSDMQFALVLLEKQRVAEIACGDGHSLTPRQWFTALSAYMYRRRSDMNPLWNGHVVAGVDQHTDEVFLGCVDLKGTVYESDSIATGFGAYLAQPLLRAALDSRQNGTMPNEAEAKALLEKCMQVLYYRDARASDKIQLATVTKAGVKISQPYHLPSDWSIA